MFLCEEIADQQDFEGKKQIPRPLPYGHNVNMVGGRMQNIINRTRDVAITDDMLVPNWIPPWKTYDTEIPDSPYRASVMAAIYQRELLKLLTKMNTLSCVSLYRYGM